MLIPEEIIFVSRLIKGNFICFAVAAIILSGISGILSRGIVANALDELKAKADWVASQESGDGVAEFIWEFL